MPTFCVHHGTRQSVRLQGGAVAQACHQYALYRRMTDDMDINCGSIVDGEETMQESGQEIFE